MSLFKKMSELILMVIALTVFSIVNAKNKSSMDTTLNPKQQSFITIAAYTAKGDLIKLKPALNAGLDTGLTVNEARGITDEWGPGASAITDGRSKYQRGKEILAKLTGASQDGPRTGYAAFSPEIEIFLKEHLFADIFERDVLSYTDRELVTVSVLSSIGGVEPMLASHLNICLNIGLTPGQLGQFMNIIKSTLGETEAKSAQAVLDEVLKNKNR